MDSAPTIDSAITASGDDGEWQMAMQLLCEMPQEWLTPNVVTYNSAIKTSGDEVERPEGRC